MAGCLPLWAKAAVAVLFWLFASAIFITFGARNLPVPFPVMRFLHIAGTSWLLILFYFVLAVGITDLLRLLVPTLGKASWFSVSNIFLWCGGAISAIFIYGYLNYINPRVVKLDITLEKPLQTESSSLRIVAVSDVHLGYGTSNRLLDKYVKLINEQNPDVVFIAGDLIDNSVKPVLERGLHKRLSGIKAAAGIYMVPGNHEYISGIGQCRELLEQTPIKLLADSVVTLPDGIKVIGRDDRMNRNRKSLERLMQEARSGSVNEAPVIVLDHQPYGLSKVDSLGVDLQISGHTHRGQVWPFNLLTDKIYEQSHGYRKWKNSHIWVSCGLSLWGPPFRIGTKSDLAVIDLR